MPRADTLLNLAGSGVTTNGKAFDCTGVSNLFVDVSLTAAAATLQGTLVFAGGLDLLETADLAAPLSFGLAINTLPTGITLTGGTLTFNNPAAATHRALLRFASPPLVVIPRFVFTSGGGVLALRVKAWG